MSTLYKVKQSDSIASIAYEHGFFPETLWDHPNNAKLKQLRKKLHILLPGDEVYIPDKRMKQESIATGQRHTFRRKSVPEILRIRFLDDDKKPRKNISYRLEVGERIAEGKTDDKGAIEEWVEPNAKSGRLTINVGKKEEIYELKIGHLNPIDEVSGVQSRLNNLGYYCGTENGELNQLALNAIKNFQRDNQLAMTGKLDDETLQCLDKHYIW